jgi:zinc D-Ala-D-Ala carboxypeptidase
MKWPMKNFKRSEVVCPHCGEYYDDDIAYRVLQNARTLYNGPLTINSGHRCAIHNARVGGAPQSQHKKVAYDISIRGGVDKERLLQACMAAGFKTFGFYSTFLHVDLRPGRRWATKQGRITWNGLIA